MLGTSMDSRLRGNDALASVARRSAVVNGSELPAMGLVPTEPNRLALCPLNATGLVC
jgi:hypothetical protein